MNKKTILQIVLISIIALLLIFGISVLSSKNQPTQETPSQDETKKTIIVSLSIEGVYSGESFEALEGDTVLKMLESLETEDQKLQLKTKEYSGLGILVESIGGKTNGDSGEYWQYKVNGVMPQVGADKFELKDGDNVEWYFDKSEF